jgi:hypothetical protein
VVCLASLAAYVARDGAVVAIWSSFRLRHLSIADFAYANMGHSQIRISGRYPTWALSLACLPGLRALSCLQVQGQVFPCLAWGLYPVCKLRDKSSHAWPEGSILSAS